LLKLKRIELQGFKSFADRTELRFHGSGIAAIVGPNGCGKSNVADAISWVLGEQSAKSLRGARMEDVIFAGTRERKALGLASVSMTLVDPGASGIQRLNGKANGHANGRANGHGGMAAGESAQASEEREVTITRRLFRSGESEYLIDGRAARLRDIQDIFMGTGLGPESYSIIEQGRIGQLLSSRPQDRRSVIEEAAGISKFKARRRLAEARLEGAKHNLERVFDILEEVGRQANSLKRQAAKARRYDEIKNELDTQLRRLLASKFRMLERDAAKIALDLNVAKNEFESLSAETATAEQQYAGAREASYSTEARLTEVRKQLAELNLQLERARGRLEAQGKQAGAIEQRLARGENEAQAIEAQAAKLAEEREAHVRNVAGQDAEFAEVTRLLQAKENERSGIQSKLSERERAIESARQGVLRLLGEASTLRNQLAQIETYLESLGRDAEKARKEEQTAKSDLEWLNASKAELDAKRAARQQQLQAVAGERRSLEEQRAQRKTELAGARGEFEKGRGEVSRLKARRDSLAEILSHRSYTTEAVKKLFTAIEKGQAEGLKPAGVLADFVEVEPEYEKAAEEFLHDELEYIVVGDWKEAEAGIEMMRSRLEGRATFVVHGEGGAPVSAEGAGAPARPEGVVAKLTDVVRLTNGFTNSPLDCVPRLSRCYIADGRESAQRLAAAYPDSFFLAPDGVWYHGHAVSGGKKPSSGPLALKRELRELKAQVETRERELAATAARIESLEKAIAGLDQEIERLRQVQQTEEKEAVALDHEARKLVEEMQRADSRLSVARLELERLEREKERSLAQRDRSRAAAEEKDRIRTAQEQALNAAREQSDALKTEAAKIAEEHSALRVRMAGLEERRRAERSAMARLEQQLNAARARAAEIARELEQQAAERTRLLNDNIALEKRVGELDGARAAAETECEKLAAEETALREKVAALEESRKRLHAAVQEAQEKRSQIEVELVKRQAELKFLDETSRKELNLGVEQLCEEDEVALDGEALDECEARCQELRRKIEALGPVNPDALQEYQEAQQRHDFLQAQRQDLLDSIRDTEKAIHEIDLETRKRFSEAFEAVNANFREVFATLFGGGTGEMRLTDEQNIGESGIDIVASPPGKRLQNVLLLSGGEKALTALALLMAIFKYQPSPFCIMDEVDAPLDEPNIQRMMRLISQMSEHTQFIIITHARRTMEVAQVLYGVTMPEPGISKLVSVKFNPLMLPPPAENAVALARA